MQSLVFPCKGESSLCSNQILLPAKAQAPSTAQGHGEGGFYLRGCHGERQPLWRYPAIRSILYLARPMPGSLMQEAAAQGSALPSSPEGDV